MINIIVVSNKSWNRDIVNELNLWLPEYHFILINDKKDFTKAVLDKLSPAKIFVPHWSYIIPAEIYTHYECVVFHMTDLPYGRGGSPLQNLIDRGHSTTKISALQVMTDIDVGPVYLKKDLCLYGTAEEVYIRANTIIMVMIKEILIHSLQPVPQKGEVVVFKRRTPEQSNLANTVELSRMFDMIRMLDAEGYPHAYIENEYFRFEFTRASLKTDGTIWADVKIIKK